MNKYTRFADKDKYYIFGWELTLNFCVPQRKNTANSGVFCCLLYAEKNVAV